MDESLVEAGVGLALRKLIVLAGATNEKDFGSSAETIAAEQEKIAALVKGSKSKHVAKACLYMRDRINVPRDMSIGAARVLRKALAEVARIDCALDAGTLADECRVPISERQRMDQLPGPFVEAAMARSKS